MAKGKVKWFNNAKGYGFILPEDGGEDLFAHYSSITMDGYKTLKAGQEVEFEVMQGPKGLHASNISALDDGPADEGSDHDGHTTEVLSVTVDGDDGLDTGEPEPADDQPQEDPAYGKARQSN